MLQAKSNSPDSLLDVVDRILDKGLVINADITVSVVGIELLGIRIRAAIASFETAARFGLGFPTGTNANAAAWQEGFQAREACPRCSRRTAVTELLNEGCPWCGWLSARAKGGKALAGNPAAVSAAGMG